MHKMLHWLARWPWIAGVVVLLALTQLSLGPWFVSAWIIIGAVLLTMLVAEAAKSRLGARVPIGVAEGATQVSETSRHQGPASDMQIA